MPTADLRVEPLSEAMLDMLEEDFRAGRGCFSGDGLALVAEVRSLRGLLEKYGEHTSACPATWAEGACRCGWTEQMDLLAGEPHERREGP